MKPEFAQERTNIPPSLGELPKRKEALWFVKQFGSLEKENILNRHHWSYNCSISRTRNGKPVTRPPPKKNTKKTQNCFTSRRKRIICHKLCSYNPGLYQKAALWLCTHSSLPYLYINSLDCYYDKLIPYNYPVHFKGTSGRLVFCIFLWDFFFCLKEENA